MCDCDCALPKHDRWAIIKRDYGNELAALLRRRASKLAILRSEDARLKAEGLRMGADTIEQEAN